MWAAKEDLRLFCPEIADKHGNAREPGRAGHSGWGKS
jgi:hypothetical protein